MVAFDQTSFALGIITACVAIPVLMVAVAAMCRRLFGPQP